jgi:DNA-binding NarL/FixJ family response regulator
MTELELDDVFADLADRYVDAVAEGDEATQRAILGGPWDGKTQPLPQYPHAMELLLQAVARMVPQPSEDDWVEIERAMDGKFPIEGLSTSAKRKVIHRLARRGLSDKQIADRIGMAARSVTRFRRAQFIAPSRPANGAQTREAS